MRRVYITSDLHLGHEKAAIYRGFRSVKEHDDLIISRFNATVNPKDTVYILGDVVFAPSKNITILERLNGVKHLILGNHEHDNVSKYISYFNKIMAFAIYHDMVLSHIPIHESQLTDRFVDCINVHGHIHGNVEDRLDKRMYFNANCEFHEFYPLLADDIHKIVRSAFYGTVNR